MKPLQRAVAAHPIAKTPYNAIKFARVDGCGTPLYTVTTDDKEMGAEAALRTAFERFGGKCFHCDAWMKPGDKTNFTLDHLRSKKNGGEARLHNLVFSCLTCNRDKGCIDMVEYRPRVTTEYLKALDAHLVRCLRKLDSK